MIPRRAAAVLVASLAACSAVEQADVATWRDAIEGTRAASRVPPADGPLGVLDVMVLANRGSETLAVAGEDYVQAILARRRAAATFLPTLALVPSFQWNEVTGVRQATALDVPVEASFALNPVRDAELVIAEGATAEQRRALLLDVQDGLLLDVARTFYDVIRAERAVEVIENSVRVQEQRVEDAEARFAAGLIRPLDVSSTRAQAAATSADLTAARNRVRTGRALLTQLVTVAVGDRPLVDSLDVPEDVAPLDELAAAAARRRVDLEAAAYRVEAARAGVRAAYGEYFPSISIDLDAFLRRESEPASLDWASLLVLSQPLFSAE
ncbi:MAG: TolC family protein [Deltaproteobacteria bacterium]|nr:TolC family protein [Deltaproteobacteria bacterium]